MVLKGIIAKAKQEDTARRIIESFTGVGIAAQEDAIWVIAAGVRMPPALEFNSVPHHGPIPSNHVRYDETAAAAYERANVPRPEPAAPVMLTEADIKRTRQWSDAQWAEMVANGFPKSNAYREQFDADGYPIARLALWSSEDVTKWETALIAALRPR